MWELKEGKALVTRSGTIWEKGSKMTYACICVKKGAKREY